MSILFLIITTHLLVLYYINDYKKLGFGFNTESPFVKKLEVIFNDNFVNAWKSQQLDNDDLQRMYLLSTDLNDAQHVIKVPAKYLSDDINIENSVINFDPRFTLGLLLRYLTETLRYNPFLDDLEIPFFHWSDYADLSLLHEDSIRPQKRKCSEFQIYGSARRTAGTLLPDVFCIDDTQLDDIITHPDTSHDMRKRLLNIKTSKLSTGFHIWQDSGKSTTDNKIIHGKLFLSDFMPSPLSMVLLLPPELNQFKGIKSLNNAIKIKINPDNRKKLIHSNMLKTYAKKYLQGVGNTQMGGEFYKEVNDDLVIDVKQDFQDFMAVLTTVNYQTLLQIPYEKHLTHELFVDNSSDILNLLNSQSDHNDIHVQNYQKSLEVSLNTPSLPKYFSEARLVKGEPHFESGAHYDWRFFNGLINMSKEQPPVLHGLIKAWFQFINNYNINSWIAHGSLLSWYWNGMSFPWDIDFDVQMTVQDLHYMCRNFNQSIVFDLGNEFGSNEIRYSKYFLDCGTFISHRKKGNGNNNIDARFIDVNTGVYVDITALALSDTKSPQRYDKLLSNVEGSVSHIVQNSHLQVYNCRNNHFQTLGDLSPLKLSFFEGQLNYIPRDYQTLLSNEYQDVSIKTLKYKAYTYVDKLKLWLDTNSLVKFIRTKYPEVPKSLKIYKGNNQLGSNNPHKIITEHFKTDQDYIDYLMPNKDVLFEFLITDQITEFHKYQIQKLDKGETTKLLMFNGDSLSRTFNPIRHDPFNFQTFTHGYDFITENEKLMENIKLWSTSVTIDDIKADPVENIEIGPQPESELQV